MTSPTIGIVAASLGILGGQGVQADRLVTLLRRDGVEVAFVPIDPPLPAWLRWVRRVRYLRTIVNQLLYLPSLLRLGSTDVAHVFSASYWSFLLAPVPAMLIGRALGKRVILHYHSGEADNHLGQWGWLVHPWLRLAHEIVVPSRYLAEVFARHGHQVRVIPNVIDLGRFGSVAREHGGQRLLSVRNLEAIYRVDVLVDAFAILKSPYPSATLTIAGVGTLESALRQHAAAVAGDRVRFVGRVEPEDMPTLYASADVFLNASVIDNQPVSMLEAFASGLPVITTPTGDIAWMVRDDESGVIVPEADPAAFADAIAALFDDPARAGRLTARAADDLRRYTWAVVGPQWQDVYVPTRKATAEKLEVGT